VIDRVERSWQALGPKRRVLVAATAMVLSIALLLIADAPDRIRPLRPETVPDPETSYELPPSSLGFPVRIELPALVNEVERHVPVEWGSLQDPIELPRRGRTTATVALRRSPFRASLTGSTARLSATVHYALQASYSLPVLPDIGMSCGTGDDGLRPRLAVTLQAPIALTSDWSLAARTRVVEVAPASSEDRDRCEVTFVGIDITEDVVEAARSFLENQRSAIDSVVGQADLRSRFVSWWQVLTEPIELAEGLWLELRPTGIRRGPTEGAGDVVEIRANLEARPRVVFGERPRPWAASLPALGDGASDGGLEILVEGMAEYAETSRLLTEALGGTVFETAGRRLEIESLELSGIGAGRVALEVRISGDALGTLFLVGTPDYSAEDGHVSVPDLALSVSTSNVLVAGASWILDAQLETVLRRRARWPVASVVGWAESALRDGLNSTLATGVRLTGSVADFKVTKVFATTRGLLVWARATGRATLLVDGDA
jgi:hypothetical protein